LPSSSISDIYSPSLHDALPISDFEPLVQLLEGIKLDSKAAVLQGRLGDLFDQEPNAKVLIFTEFRETQEMLKGLLSNKWAVHILDRKSTRLNSSHGSISYAVFC